MVSQQFTDKRKEHIHTTLTTPKCQTLYLALQELTNSNNPGENWVRKQTLTQHATTSEGDVRKALQKLQTPGLIERRYTTTETTDETISVFRIATTPDKYAATINNALNSPTQNT